MRRGSYAKFLAAGLGGFAPVVLGLEIRDETSPEVGEFRRVWTVHDRAEMNPFFEPGAERFSGIGWPFPEEWHRQYSLVSPRHFLGAAHYPPEIGWKMRFLGTDGKLRDYEVEAVEMVEDADGAKVDLFVGVLAETDEAVRPFAVWEAVEGLVGREVLVFGKAAKAMPAVIDGIVGPEDVRGRHGATRLGYFDFDPAGGEPGDIRYESGDSGSPAFVMTAGGPVLCGVASTVEEVGGLTRSLMALVPEYLEEIDALMAPLGYHLIRSSPPDGPEIKIGLVTDGSWTAGRAGRARLTVGNPDDVTRHNLRVRVSATASPVRFSGEGWVAERSGNDEWECRRGGLAAGETAVIHLRWPEIPDGEVTVVLRASADGLEAAMASAALSAGRAGEGTETGVE